MNIFIVAVPLFSSEMSVNAYKLKYQNSGKLFGTKNDHWALDGAMNSPGIDILNKVGLEPFTGGKPIFVPINKFTLLSEGNLKAGIKPADVIYILGSDVPTEDMYFEKCEKLLNSGFSIALEDIELTPETEPFFSLAEFVVIDASKPDFPGKLRQIRFKHPKMKILLTNITAKSYFDEIRGTSHALFEGSFYSQPVTRGVTKISPIKANALRLLKLVGEEDFELEEVTKVVQMDASLSISLLRFINSPGINLVGKINSINHAVAMLGQRETAKWINAAVSIRMADNKQNEITKLSLIRAKFAESLAAGFGFKADSSSLFLLGLFSLLDVVLDMPMSHAINEVSVNDNIRQALVSGKGPYAQILKLIYAYERANWDEVSYICIMNNIDLGELNDTFINTLLWYKELIENIEE